MVPLLAVSASIYPHKPIMAAQVQSHPEDGSMFIAQALVPVSYEKRAQPIILELSCFASGVLKLARIQNEAVNYSALN